MQSRIGILAGDLPQAAGLGLPYARQGAVVRIYSGRAIIDGLPDRLISTRPEVAIVVTDGDRQREAKAAGILRAWEQGDPPYRPESLCRPCPPEEEASQAGATLSANSGTLVLVGSCAPQARVQVERLADEGALLLTLHREAVLNQDESYLMGIRSGAAVALGQGRTVVVRSENWPEALVVTRKLAARVGLSVDELESRVRKMLGRVGDGVVRGVVASEGTRKLVAVGTETSSALCGQLGISELIVSRETAGSLPILQTPGPNSLLLALKAGSVGEPDTLVQAVLDLGALRMG